jgi:non-specific protein-tyrosine kinase
MDGPRYATLRDYLRVLRSYRLMIVVLAVLGGGIALFLSLREQSVYQATASVEFKDPTTELALFGISSAPPNQPATQQAAAAARTVTRPGVLITAAHQLGVKQLNATVSTTVDPTSSLVDIGAQSSDPARAAAVANAVARTAVKNSNAQLRGRFAAASRTLRKQAGHLGKTDPTTQLFTQGELTRLDSLSKFAQAANLVDRASVPGVPVSPNPTRSAVLGLIGGLLVGLLLAFLRDSLDRRLQSARDLEAHFELPVLGYVRNEAMGRTAYVKNGSNGKASVDQLDLEAFRIMRRNLDFVNPSDDGRLILVTSAFPAEGKTTVSSSLAFSMAIAGKRTLLVEADLRRPVLAARLNLAPTPGLTDYLAGHAEPREILRTVPVAEPALNGAGPNGASAHSVVLIPAGTPTPHAAELLGSERLKTFLAEVVESYDAVVIDSSPLLPVADTRELLPHVGVVIICARESQTTREQARATRETLGHLPERPTVMVITGTRPDDGDYAGYAYAYAYQAQR